MDEVYQLKSGDTLTLYTDGITEAINRHGLFYGEDRLIDIFNHKEYSCLVELHHSLKDDIERFPAEAFYALRAAGNGLYIHFRAS